MIIVTGTKRSGTSMWMQALKAAGLPVLGEAFSGSWGESIRDANPKGFYESPFRQGVFYATNPDPKTGAYLRPEETKRVVVKVFVPGLIRTDIAYVDHVIATMRPWREYTRSIRKLYALEDAHHETLEDEAREKARRAVRRGRPRIPPEVEWWLEYYELIRDVATRRYPIHLTSYRRVLADPDRELGKVLKWVGGGDVAAATAAIDGTLYRSHEGDEVDSDLDPETIALMDELYDRVDQEKGLDPQIIGALNEHQKRVTARFGEPSRDRLREDLEAPGEREGR